MKLYAPAEERLNIITHGIGFIMSLAGLALLLWKALNTGNTWHVAGNTIFGISLVILYGASTLYHSASDLKKRRHLKVFDHAAIYVLIAGTYTPFTLVTLHGTTGWILFGVIWTMALTGIIFKLFFTGRFSAVSTVTYVLMGWVAIFAFKPLMVSLPIEGLYWIVGGGVAYTLGAVLYSIKRIPFNHAIFHVFVLIGSFCHFMAILFYVIPGT